MAVTETTPEATAPAVDRPVETPPGELERLLGTGDHTSIGRLYVGFALLFIVTALLARAVAAIDHLFDNEVLGDTAVLVSTSSLVALVFLGAVPLLLGLAIHLVPLQVGSPSIAFPRAAAASLWSWLVFAVIFVTSAAVNGGVGGTDPDAAVLGNVALGAMLVALGLGAVCVATTVLAHRPAGMGLARVPLFAWACLVGSVIWIVSFGPAVAYVALNHLGATGAEDLLEGFTSGLGWLLRSPAVFMLAIPVLGIAGDVTAVATGRPLARYGIFQAMIGAYAILSFGAWAIAPRAVDTVLWSLTALLIGLPVLGMLGGIAESTRHGRIRLSAALIGSVLALVNLLAAALIGVVMAFDTIGSDNPFGFEAVRLGEAQTVFVVTAVVAGGLSALAHWSVKVWGSEASESAARTSIALVDVGGFVLGATLAVQVFVQNDGGNSGRVIFGSLAAIGAVVMLVGVLGALVASLGAARDASDVPPEDPFGGLTLEWQTPSPAVGGLRTAEIPEVGSPYPLYAGDDADGGADKEAN